MCNGLGEHMRRNMKTSCTINFSQLDRLWRTILRAFAIIIAGVPALLLANIRKLKWVNTFTMRWWPQTAASSRDQRHRLQWHRVWHPSGL